ncbi:uncharacterized protein LOC132611952 [Lycium barbarum]|uniref:uncharacterized protein LOC132611952 n=1 Tax=Lycium barbarum TaxID=112863 RepID=UPI00293EB424|nr:uncharacterized protein LOC132611952 [Lycium barbarum]
MVKAFFVGQELPRFITHTNLILIPKKEQVQSFSDLKRISLNNFTNKIISRVLHERLVKLLPGLISENQSGFVKGKSIMENVLLTQDIVRDINKRTKTANIVATIKQLVSSSLEWESTWIYQVIKGSFKQGYPLSPTLFILAVEALSRGLNALYKKPRFVEYGMPKWSPRINHLSYADDTILFVSADQYSVTLMMRVLNRYEKVSRQLVNLNKSAFYVHEKVQSGLVSRLKQTTGIRQGLFLFTYLGCLIFYSRNKISHYDTVVKKITKRVNAWQERLLSYGGRATLISHSNTGDKKGVHWVKWETLSLPKDEDGLGFRSLFEVSNTLFYKLWRNLRTKPSLWSSFMINKYYKKLHPVIAQAKGAFPIWRKLVIVRELVEHQIWWQVKKGDSSLWYSTGGIAYSIYAIKVVNKELQTHPEAYNSCNPYNHNLEPMEKKKHH